VVEGTQGHVAYPQLADNPVPVLVRILSEIDVIVLDEGRDWFQASNIEVTTIDVGNPATNVIPAQATARLSIRFNDLQRGDALIERIRSIAGKHSPRATVTGRIYGEAFLPPPGKLSSLIAESVKTVTGLDPELPTTEMRINPPAGIPSRPGPRRCSRRVAGHGGGYWTASR
jgi:succinyl-diaminopimelate desuccinylase